MGRDGFVSTVYGADTSEAGFRICVDQASHTPASGTDLLYSTASCLLAAPPGQICST